MQALVNKYKKVIQEHISNKDASIAPTEVFKSLLNVYLKEFPNATFQRGLSQLLAKISDFDVLIAQLNTYSKNRNVNNGISAFDHLLVAYFYYYAPLLKNSMAGKEVLDSHIGYLTKLYTDERCDTVIKDLIKSNYWNSDRCLDQLTLPSEKFDEVYHYVKENFKSFRDYTNLNILNHPQVPQDDLRNFIFKRIDSINSSWSNDRQVSPNLYDLHRINIPAELSDEVYNRMFRTGSFKHLLEMKFIYQLSYHKKILHIINKLNLSEDNKVHFRTLLNNIFEEHPYFSYSLKYSNIDLDEKVALKCVSYILDDTSSDFFLYERVENIKNCLSYCDPSLLATLIDSYLAKDNLNPEKYILLCVAMKHAEVSAETKQMLVAKVYAIAKEKSYNSAAASGVLIDLGNDSKLDLDELIQCLVNGNYYEMCHVVKHLSLPEPQMRAVLDHLLHVLDFAVQDCSHVIKVLKEHVTLLSPIQKTRFIDTLLYSGLPYDADRTAADALVGKMTWPAEKLGTIIDYLINRSFEEGNLNTEQSTTKALLALADQLTDPEKIAMDIKIDSVMEKHTSIFFNSHQVFHDEINKKISAHYALQLQDQAKVERMPSFSRASR